jgi:2-desacetyl-2-hydroxyethyl bacteriochlorophyllide A dehydrogenase
MKQARLHGPGDLRVDEVPQPTLGARDVLIKVATAGICGSDLHFYHLGGIAQPTDRPLPIGHELSGTVAAVGGEVADLRVGERVVVNPMEGNNLIGTGGSEGGFAEYLLVRNAERGRSIHPIPDRLSFDRAALVEPVAVGAHGLNLAGAKAGETAVVYGAGPIGLGVVARLKYLGASKIVAVDLVESRLERALQLGADAVINPAKTDLRTELANLFGEAKHAFATGMIDCDLFIDAAGVGALLQQTVEIARNGARIVVLARHREPVAVDMVKVMSKELMIHGSLCYPTEFAEVIDMLADERVDIDPMVSHTFPLARFDEAFRTALDAKASAKVLVRAS